MKGCTEGSKGYVWNISVSVNAIVASKCAATATTQNISVYARVITTTMRDIVTTMWAVTVTVYATMSLPRFRTRVSCKKKYLSGAI